MFLDEYILGTAETALEQPIQQAALRDYSQFNPRQYIQEYYSQIGSENEFILNFLHKTYSSASSDASLLEFGGGPTIYQLISAAQKVKDITFAEYLKCNRDEVSSWIKNEKNAVDWDLYLDFVLQLDSKMLSEENRNQLKRNLQTKLKDIIECDAYRADVLKKHWQKQFDIVSSGFCLECISPSEQAFNTFVKKVTSLTKPGGMFVMTLLKNSESYKINDLSFCTFPVDEDYMLNLLTNFGFCDIRISSVDAELDQGYEGIIAIKATRNA